MSIVGNHSNFILLDWVLVKGLDDDSQRAVEGVSSEKWWDLKRN